MKRRVRWGRAGVDRVRVAAGQQSLLPPAELVPLFQSGGQEEQIGVNGSHTERIRDYMHTIVGITDCIIFVTTKVLSRQTRRDKTFVATSILLSRQKTGFVMTNTCLSRQHFCRDKNDTCGSCRQ